MNCSSFNHIWILFLFFKCDFTISSEHSRKGKNINQSTEKRLIQSLLGPYSSLSRPIMNSTKAVVIEVGLELIQIEDLDEKNQVLNIFCWLFMAWTDEFLKWSPEQYDGIQKIITPTNRIWRPDIGIENSADTIYNDLFDEKKFKSQVSSDGRVSWVTGGKLTTSCAFDMTYFPFDEQKCELRIANWAYTGIQVHITNMSNTIGLSLYSQSGEWDILKTTAESNIAYYTDLPFPSVTMSLYLKRKPLYYILNVMTPCMILSLLALFVFFLPAEAGEKIGMGITVLLSFSVFQLMIADKMPETSDFIPLIGLYLLLIMCLTGLSMILSLVVLNVHHHDPNEPIPDWIKRHILGHMARLVCFSGCCKYDKPKQRNLHSLRRPQFVNGTSETEQDQMIGDKLKEFGDTSMTHRSRTLSLDARMYAEETSRGEDGTKPLNEDWLTVARVLDRFFFYLFGLITSVITVAVIGIYPFTQPSILEK